MSEREKQERETWAVRFSALQCITVCCSVCSVLQCVAACCSVLQCVACVAERDLGSKPKTAQR